MRRSLLLASFLIATQLHAQAIPWKSIVAREAVGNLNEETLSPQARRSIRTVLSLKGSGWASCEEEDTTWTENLTYEHIRLGPGRTTLVEAGMGCARGGQGSNGAMWIIQWQDNKPVVIGQLYGWVHGVQPHISYGMHDVTVGWHMSAYEYILKLFRFDGTRYLPIGTADVTCNDEQVCNAKPEKP